MSGAGVDDQTGRLVDDEEVLVLVGNPEIERLVLELGLGDRGRIEIDVLATVQPVALRPRGAVDLDRAGAQQALGRSA
jgi:hypothetical protein